MLAVSLVLMIFRVAPALAENSLMRLPPAHSREFWEAKLKCVRIGMTQDEVEQVIPSVSGSGILTGGGWSMRNDLDEKWTLQVFYRILPPENSDHTKEFWYISGKWLVNSLPQVVRRSSRSTEHTRGDVSLWVSMLEPTILGKPIEAEITLVNKGHDTVSWDEVNGFPVCQMQLSDTNGNLCPFTKLGRGIFSKKSAQKPLRKLLGPEKTNQWIIDLAKLFELDPGRHQSGQHQFIISIADNFSLASSSVLNFSSYQFDFILETHKSYPASDALMKGVPLDIPPEFKAGTASFYEACQWSISLLSHLQEQPNLEVLWKGLNFDRRSHPLISEQANAGTGGNLHLVFQNTTNGFRYLGSLSFSALLPLPPDSQGRMRLITSWHLSNGESVLDLMVHQLDGFHSASKKTIHDGDGGADEGKQIRSELFDSKEVPPGLLRRLFDKAYEQSEQK